MSSGNENLRCVLTFTVMLMVCLAGSPAFAALDNITKDGWHTWRVAANDAAPNWCCFVWNGGHAQTKSCDLDSRHINYGSADEVVAGLGEMQLYVLIADGNVSKLRTLAPQCAVTSQTAIADLGLVAGNESVNWLKQHIAPHTKVSTHALAAISVHAGSKPLDLLVDVARNSDNFANRKNALFWLAEVRGADAESQIEDLMFNDSNPDFREHAAFSLSQSAAPGRVAALVRLGNNDVDSDVRSQAWFWLAQTGALDSEAEIQKAIRHEKTGAVREQAIFALSQLPDERATEALIDVIEDRHLTNADRKHALFWLVQLDSAPALAYLGRVLGSR